MKERPEISMEKIEIQGSQRLRGEVEISGAKNAALPVMAASLLASSPCVVKNIPCLRDVDSMIEALSYVGAGVTRQESTIQIDPRGFNRAEAPYHIVRKMRASIYVLGPMLARLGRAHVSLPGGCVIGTRPIDLHLKGLKALGADIDLKHGYIEAEAKTLKGVETPLEGAFGTSVGATCNVMMAASLAQGTTIIRGAAREPEVIDLGAYLNQMGAEIDGAGTSTMVINGVKQLNGVEYEIIPDRIEAGTYMVAAAITKGDLIINNCRLAHMQAVVEKLREIGVKIEPQQEGIRVWVDEELRPVSIRTLPYPGFPTDMQAQFMALLSLVKGESIITETIFVDRFLHAAELRRMGADITTGQGTVTIRGVAKLSGAPVMASDLRASAALVLAGLAAEGQTLVLRVYHIDRGYERIEEKLSALGAKIKRVT